MSRALSPFVACYAVSATENAPQSLHLRFTRPCSQKLLPPQSASAFVIDTLLNAFERLVFPTAEWNAHVATIKLTPDGPAHLPADTVPD
eukprot:scaffold78290_cov48-Phaeocystis_antarctica.AAC.1